MISNLLQDGGRRSSGTDNTTHSVKYVTLWWNKVMWNLQSLVDANRSHFTTIFMVFWKQFTNWNGKKYYFAPVKTCNDSLVRTKRVLPLISLLSHHQCILSKVYVRMNNLNFLARFFWFFFLPCSWPIPLKLAIWMCLYVKNILLHKTNKLSLHYNVFHGRKIISHRGQNCSLELKWLEIQN